MPVLRIRCRMPTTCDLPGQRTSGDVKSDGDSTASRLASERDTQVDVFGFVLNAQSFPPTRPDARGNLQEFIAPLQHLLYSYSNAPIIAAAISTRAATRHSLSTADSYLLPLYPPEPRPDAHGGEPDPGREEALLERYSLSSYPGYIFPKHRYPWITYELLEHFGGDSPKGRAAYGGSSKRASPETRRSPGKGEVTVSSAMRPSSRGLPALFRRSRLTREVPAIRRMARTRGPERIISIVSDATA